MEKADITVELVRRLVATQMPQWAGLPVRPVELDGWDNTTFRLGDDLSVRLPSHEHYVPQVDREHRWLPVLAPHLPLPIPRPVARGQPGCGFPRPWSVYEWIEGEPLGRTGVDDLDRLADDLAAFLTSLQRVPADDGPAAGDHSFQRGGPVSVWDEQVRQLVDRLEERIDAPGAMAVWEAALAAPWRGPDVWVHGDVTGSNLLVRDGRLAAVIDFGCSAVGDPACDLTIAWTGLEGTSRSRFVQAMGGDDATWARARGWALWKAMLSAADDPIDGLEAGVRFGWRWDALGVVEQVVADHRQSG